MRRAWIIGIVVVGVRRLAHVDRHRRPAVPVRHRRLAGDRHARPQHADRATTGRSRSATARSWASAPTPAAILVRDQGMSYPLVHRRGVRHLLRRRRGLIGIPALRLPGTSLALITLAFALAFPQVLKKYDVRHRRRAGHQHAAGPAVQLPVADSLTNDQFRYLVLRRRRRSSCSGSAWNIVRGRWGLAMMSVRDNPVSAASMGVNLARTKVATFAISAGYAGVGGRPAVHDRRLHQPRQLGRWPCRSAC